MAPRHAVHQCFRAEFDDEARGGFVRMSRIPDTSVRVFVDHYRSPKHSEQDALADAVTHVGSAKAFPPLWEMPEYEAVKANPAWVRWRQLRFSRARGWPAAASHVRVGATETDGR